MSKITLATQDLHSSLWLWLCFRAAAYTHCYNKELHCLTSLRSVCNINNIHMNICHQLVRAISYRQNAFQRVLSLLIEPAKMDFAITLTTVERGYRCRAESMTLSWIRCCKSRATCGLKMLCWWVNTQTHGPAKAYELYHGNLGTMESEHILPSTCAV